MAAKRKGFTRRLIKRNALGQFARVAGSGRKAGRRGRAFVGSKVARTKMGRRLTIDRMYHQRMRSIKSRNRKSLVGKSLRMGVNSAKGAALGVQAKRQRRKAGKLQASILNYYVHGKKDRTFRRMDRKVRRR